MSCSLNLALGEKHATPDKLASDIQIKPGQQQGYKRSVTNPSGQTGNRSRSRHQQRLGGETAYGFLHILDNQE
jgi:hypothetical protein